MTYFPAEAGISQGAIRLWRAGQQLKSAKSANLQRRGMSYEREEEFLDLYELAKKQKTKKQTTTKKQRDNENTTSITENSGQNRDGEGSEAFK